jgi:NADH:ubiquinone oxidoreductase subunit 4 (subunit M)
MPKASKRSRRSLLIFNRRNYVLMIAGVLAVIVGFAMMRIDNQLDGFVSLYVAPLIILGGYIEIIYAILWYPNEDDEADQ